MSIYRMVIESKVQGIPCCVGVIAVHVTPGSYSRNAPSDIDYYGDTEYEYDILDRRGRLAPWLERKATDDDHYALQCAIDKACAEERMHHENI